MSRTMAFKVSVAAAAMALIVGAAMPASAAETNDKLDALNNIGLLTPPMAVQVDDQSDSQARTASSGPSGELIPNRGLAVTNGDSVVTITPVTDQASGQLDATGTALEYAASESFSYVLTGAGTAANAGYVVIADASAPITYQFQINVDGSAAGLALGEDGSIQVTDDFGTQANVILPAWAKDANGAAVPTSYAVNGNVITQTIEHAGAAYPVVADPGLACDALFCTYEYDRSQTEMIANADATMLFLISAGCTAVGGPVGGFACGLSSVALTSTANTALANGNCMGIRKFHTSPLVFPVEVSC